jgi:hypothetical protein
MGVMFFETPQCELRCGDEPRVEPINGGGGGVICTMPLPYEARDAPSYFDYDEHGDGHLRGALKPYLSEEVDNSLDWPWSRHTVGVEKSGTPKAAVASTNPDAGSRWREDDADVEMETGEEIDSVASASGASGSAGACAGACAGADAADKLSDAHGKSAETAAAKLHSTPRGLRMAQLSGLDTVREILYAAYGGDLVRLAEDIPKYHS